MRRLALALLPILAIVLLAGCPQQPADDGHTPPKPEKDYPDGPDGLRQLWSDILSASQHDERERVHRLMASTMMTDPELDDLFGKERAAYLRPRYEPMISTLINIGAMELVARVTERKYDDIEVLPVDDKSPPECRAALKALAKPQPVYFVRVKRKGQATGLRYDFWVYRDHHWVTGNQLGKYLVESPDGGTK